MSTLDYNNAATPSFQICEEALLILRGDPVTPSHHPNLKQNFSLVGRLRMQAHSSLPGPPWNYAWAWCCVFYCLPGGSRNIGVEVHEDPPPRSRSFVGLKNLYVRERLGLGLPDIHQEACWLGARCLLAGMGRFTAHSRGSERAARHEPLHGPPILGNLNIHSTFFYPHTLLMDYAIGGSAHEHSRFGDDTQTVFRRISMATKFC